MKLIEEEEPPMNSTVLKNYMHTIKQFPLCGFQAYRAGLSTNAKKIVDQYTIITYAQSQCYIQKITEMLLAEGLKKDDRVVIYAKNSPLWLQSDLAISFAGGVTAPIYDTLGLDNIAHCINIVQARFVMVSGEYLPNILGMLDQLPSVQRVVSFDSIELESTLQQTMKVYVQLCDSGAVINDDAHSMYSISPASELGRQDLLVAAQEIIPENNGDEESKQKKKSFTDLLQGKEGKNGVTVVCMPQFVDPTSYNIRVAHEYLMQRIELLQQCPEDINSVFFTSGTSGKPKAVLTTHSNVISGGACLGRQFVPYHFADSGRQSSFLSYLPLAHVFERCMEHLGIYRGHLIYYSSGNTRNLTQDLLLSRPTLMIGVPRVYAKIHSAVMQSVQSSGLLTRAVFKTAYNLKRFYFWLNPAGLSTGRMPIVDLVFKEIKSKLGGNVEYIISGSSALPGEVRTFLEICTGARVTVGYGLTEASTTGLYNYCGQHFNSPSQLGFTCAFMEGVIADRSDQCEFSTAKDAVGELMLKGPGIALGYLQEWKQGEKPVYKSLVDAQGYYATGDLCQLHEDGSVSFIRRLGLVVKLQHGEFVDLEAIETALENHPLITAAVVHAEPDKTAPICIVSVDSRALGEALGTEKLEQLKNGDSAAQREAEQLVYDLGNTLIRARGLKGFNVPKAYKVLLDQNWSSDPNLYTPSQKKKHAAIVKHYADDLARLWTIVAQRERQQKVDTSKKITNYTIWVSVFVTLLVVGAALIYWIK